MADFNIGAVVSTYFNSGIFWVVIIILCGILVMFFIGFFNRRAKLKYNCLEVIRFGNGKVGVNMMKAGVFGSKTFLKFWDYGRETVAKTSDGRIIQGARSSHLHDIFGKKGYIIIRNPKDAKILVPVSKIDFENLHLLLSVASSDYRDASTRIFKEAVEETKGTWDKVLPYIMVGLCIFLCIITVVICMQMTNNAVNKVGQLLISGCSNVQNGKVGTSP